MRRLSSRTLGGGLGVVLGTCAGGALVFFLLLRAPGAGRGAQGLDGAPASATPQFLQGFERGVERAGFSGRSMVIVFSGARPADMTLKECLESEAVTRSMDRFTGILVDEAAEPQVESILRKRDGLKVVVRGLNGALLGGIQDGFKCQDLSSLLLAVRSNMPGEPEKSPIYANLLESPGAITHLVSEGKRDEAVKYVEFLRELEGAESPAVRAAEAALGP